MDVAASVTKDTSILVVGDQDVRKFGGHEQSTKHRKAEQLNRRGARIRIIGESDFRLLIGDSLRTSCSDSPSSPQLFSQRRDRFSSVCVAETPEAARIASLVEAVNAAKREGRLHDACKLLTEEIERQEDESRRTNLGVAPWYYEQLAIVFRKLGRDHDELDVLERYDRQIKAPGAAPAVLKARLEKVRAKLMSRDA